MNVTETFQALENACKKWYTRPYVGAPFILMPMGFGIAIGCGESNILGPYLYGYLDLARKPTEDEMYYTGVWVQGKLFGWSSVEWHDIEKPKELPDTLWNSKWISPWTWTGKNS